MSEPDADSQEKEEELQVYNVKPRPWQVVRIGSRLESFRMVEILLLCIKVHENTTRTC